MSCKNKKEERENEVKGRTKDLSEKKAKMKTALTKNTENLSNSRH